MKENPNIYLDYDILKLLNEQNKPLGALNLSVILGEKHNVSQSTIGRRLLIMDHLGYTQKVKNMGRILTEKGKDFLTDLDYELSNEKVKSNFFESLNPSTLKDLIDILIARRGLEKESASLAALNANEEEITKMEEVLAEQKRKIDVFGIAGDEEDSRFHRLIATASKNKVLYIAVTLLRKQNDLAMHFGTVRKIIGGELYYEHNRILSCIKKRDSKGAEQAMEDHINKIIREFSNFSTLSEAELKYE